MSDTDNLLAHKIELRPTAQQAEFLDKCMGCARHLYNQLVAHFGEEEVVGEFVNEEGKTVEKKQPARKYDRQKINPLVAELKKQFPFYAEVPARIFEYVKQDYQAAMSRFFGNVKKKRRVGSKKNPYGKPTFKSKHDGRDSFNVDQNIHEQGRTIKLTGMHKHKIPALAMRRKRRWEGELRRVTVSKHAGKYFASLLVETEDYEKTYQKRSELVEKQDCIGVDLGVNHLAVLSDTPSFTGDVVKGQLIDNPRLLERNLKRLKRLQRKMSRQKRVVMPAQAAQRAQIAVQWAEAAIERAPDAQKDKCQQLAVTARKKAEEAMQYAAETTTATHERVYHQAMQKAINAAKQAKAAATRTRNAAGLTIDEIHNYLQPKGENGDKANPQHLILKDSNRLAKTKRRVARVHYRVANQRQEMLHQLTHELTLHYREVKIENLNVKGMQQGNIARSVSDVAFGEFRRQLEYKGQLRGTTITPVDRYYPSSKTCSRCGKVKEDLKRGDRTFRCNECGYKEDRDINAAINIKNWTTEQGARIKTHVEDDNSGGSSGNLGNRSVKREPVNKPSQ